MINYDNFLWHIESKEVDITYEPHCIINQKMTMCAIYDEEGFQVSDEVGESAKEVLENIVKAHNRYYRVSV